MNSWKDNIMIELPYKIFSIKNDVGDYIELILTNTYEYPDITSFWGGYDFLGNLNIKINDVTIHDENFQFITADLFEYLDQLVVCNQKLKGKVEYNPKNHDATQLTINTTFNQQGGCITVLEYNYNGNYFKCNFSTNQSYLQLAIEELQQFRNILK